eukprot:4125634-Pyramimonas_sp.AAC.1
MKGTVHDVSTLGRRGSHRRLVIGHILSEKDRFDTVCRGRNLQDGLRTEPPVAGDRNLCQSLGEQGCT